MLSQTSEPMKKAVGVLADLSADEKARMRAEDREKWMRDQMSRERGAREEGLREGMQKGMQKGILTTAQSMLGLGYPLEAIAKITGLDESELRRMQ